MKKLLGLLTGVLLFISNVQGQSVLSYEKGWEYHGVVFVVDGSQSTVTAWIKLRQIMTSVNGVEYVIKWDKRSGYVTKNGVSIGRVYFKSVKRGRVDCVYVYAEAPCGENAEELFYFSLYRYSSNSKVPWDVVSLDNITNRKCGTPLRVQSTEQTSN
jgi:hypothetical protein